MTPTRSGFFPPKGHPLSAGVRVVLVIVRGVWSNACIPLGFDFWFPKLPHHLEEGQWLFGWITGPICQCRIRFLPNPGFSIIKYKEGHGVKERPTYVFTWVPPEPDDQQSITGPHRAQNHHPKGSGYTGSQDAYWPVFYSHTSQQIYHLGSLGFSESPGTKLRADRHCSLLPKRLTQPVLGLYGNLDDSLKKDNHCEGFTPEGGVGGPK